MTDAATIRALIDRYMNAMSAGDRDTWVACFAPGASLEDPVGSEMLTGAEAIGGFFDNAHALADAISMEATGPVRVAAGEAAFPFRIVTTIGDSRFTLPVVDVMSFDDEGLITSMRAFWDMADLSPVGD